MPMALSCWILPIRGGELRLEMPREPESYEVAVEQYVYWRELGLSHDEMLRAVGIRPSWQGPLSSAAMIEALAAAYRMLIAERAA